MNNIRKKPATNKWLLWGVIVLTVLLIIWLTFFEYIGAADEGQFMKQENAIEQTQTK